MLKKLWDKGWTPIKITVLQKYLANYKNQIDAKLLLDGFTKGFHLQYTGPRMAVDAKNLNSANIYKFETLNKLQSEVQLGRMIGPFKEKTHFNS